MTFKGRAVGPQEAARQLGVRYVLEGSVRRAGDRVRIAVRLVDGTDGAQIWSDRFDGSLDDAFALQDKVALSVAGVIEPAIIEAEVRRAAARPPQDSTAYDLYLQARQAIQTLAHDDLVKGVGLLRQAVAIAPGYAPALGLAAWYLMLMRRMSEDLSANREEALALARRAVKAGGDDADVLVYAASVFMAFGEDETSGSLADRALVLNPGSAVAWYFKGAREALRHPENGVELLQTSLRLDPRSNYLRPYVLLYLGAASFALRRFEEAAALLAESQQLMPGLRSGRSLRLACLGHLKREAEVQALASHFTPAEHREIRIWEQMFRRPEDQKLFIEGIALALGEKAAAAHRDV